jgi:hypothetical protein
VLELVERADGDVDQVLEVFAVLDHRHPQRLGDLLVGHLAAEAALEVGEHGADLASHLAAAAGHDVAAAQLVEHRAPDALLGEHQERLLALLVVALGGLGQAEHAGGDQIIRRDPRRAAARDPQRDPPRDLDVLDDQPVAVARRAPRLLGIGFHGVSPAGTSWQLQNCWALSRR